MNIKYYFIGLLISTTLIMSCNRSGGSSFVDNSEEQIINTDSIELTNLVRNVYEWHETKYRKNGFPYKFNTPNNTIFTGVDWDEYAKDMEVYKSTNFFSKEFFTIHRIHALSIDSSIKQASIEWRNINDGIPLWSTDADDWCNCQDNPENYWKNITLNSFVFINNMVTFKWTWDTKIEANSHQYEMKATRENGTWKISEIEGFKYYGTVADYNKTMIK